jgi:hypothetical protein
MGEDGSGRLGRGDREVVLWRCSRHAARSGQGGLRGLEMWLKGGGVPAVLSGAMISMGKLLEKLGPKRYVTRVRGREILRSSHKSHPILSCFLDAPAIHRPTVR